MTRLACAGVLTAGLNLVTPIARASDEPGPPPAVAAPAADSAGATVEQGQRVCPAPIGAGDVRPHIERLAGPEFRGRRGDDALRAAHYIREQFEQAGLKPLFEDDDYLQPIPGVLGDDTETRIIGRNVGGWVPGSDEMLRNEFVIISAHYDHLGVRGTGVHPGADDNASGVAMLLEAARHVASAGEPRSSVPDAASVRDADATRAALSGRPRRSIVFVAFDLEEHLLWGSRWFAAHPPWDLERVKLFITADMIGRSLGNLPLPTVFVLGSEHAPLLKAMLDDIGAPEGLEAARLGVDLIGTRSDYGPFRDQKVPFLFFSTGEHPDYHTPRDTPERIDYDKVARVSNLVLAVARHAADADETPQWMDAPEADLDEARTVHRITTLLLEADQAGEMTLGGVQKFFVSQVKNQTAAIIERGKLTPAERSALVKAAQLLLLSVF
jgi:hypothetical protein